MSDAIVSDFPLFPLGMVALPGELVPLHIFEERYKTMIGHCLETKTEFGIVWSGDDGLHEVGCAMEITELLEEMDDGRLNILTRGTRPFAILERTDALVYPAGRVAFLEDENEQPDPAAYAGAQRVYAELVEEATDKVPDREELDAMTAYSMAATVDFGVEAKQNLLELRSENARMNLVARLFRAALKRLDYVERSQVAARSNGKVRFS